MVQPIHIANGSGLPLLVSIRSDRRNVLSSEFGQNARQPLGQSTSSETLRIKTGTYAQFLPHASNSNVFFVSAAVADKDGPFVISEAFELPEGRNLVVGHDKQVHLTRPGCTWVDESGHHHWLCTSSHFPLIPVNETSKISS